jgi:putative transposase
MTLPRSAQIALQHTPYYHCIARCVRRAFLCGEDHYSGQDFNHRRQWLIDRMKAQAGCFAIDICAYAVMSNHYHVVLRVDEERSRVWSDHEVIQRWCALFKGPIVAQRYLADDSLTAAERLTLAEIASVWRERLCSISWFMRCLNEQIARQANAEDGCKGRFWEGRFK